MRAALEEDAEDSPARAPRRAGATSAAPPPSAPSAAPSAAVAPPPDGEDAAEDVSPLEAAFNQLQSLFPGRVVEVLPLQNDAENDVEATSPLEDGYPATDGYDDDDQEPLSFGPDAD